MPVLIFITVSSQRNSGCAIAKKNDTAYGGIFWGLQGQRVWKWNSLITQWWKFNDRSSLDHTCVVQYVVFSSFLCLCPFSCREAVRLCKHLVTAAVERLTTEQWTASWSIHYCLFRATTRIAFAPPQVSHSKKMSLWPLMFIGKKTLVQFCQYVSIDHNCNYS